MGSGWAELSVHGPGLGWAVGCTDRGEHCTRPMFREVHPQNKGRVRIPSVVLLGLRLTPVRAGRVFVAGMRRE